VAGRTLQLTGRSLASVGVASGTAAIWVAVCAASPELIWRGLQVSLRHLTRADLLAALAIGLVLAFFVEPGMHRLRRLLDGAHDADPPARPHALVTAVVSLAFALASVCLHEAITTFAAGDGQHTDEAGVLAAFALVAAWAAVPFCVTLAWLSAPWPWLGIPMAALAAMSPLVAGWAFHWSVLGIVATEITALAILLLGLRAVPRLPEARLFRRCAAIVAGVAAAWLLLVLLADALSHALGSRPLYGLARAGIDLRFYLGWVVGLLLAPFPYARR
jgi:hypothetical protein